MHAPKNLCDLVRLPFSAISIRPLRSLHDLFVPRASRPTSVVQTTDVAIKWPCYVPNFLIWHAPPY